MLKGRHSVCEPARSVINIKKGTKRNDNGEFGTSET